MVPDRKALSKDKWRRHGDAQSAPRSTDRQTEPHSSTSGEGSAERADAAYGTDREDLLALSCCLSRPSLPRDVGQRASTITDGYKSPARLVLNNKGKTETLPDK